VVLPFENLGASGDEYFAAGLTEEITSRLATVPGLGVISRTSAMQYKDDRPPLREIGQQLGVDYVLEGTVRWERRSDGTSRVRVTPQLIRVADDTHLWADRYDRELEEIFAVQGDIAAEVARELNITLLEPQREALQTRPTENMEAYQAYLRGVELWTRPGYDVARFRLAQEMFERAVELDPRFVEALTELSNVHAMLYQGGSAGPEALVASREAIEQAEAVAPDHPRVHLAKGYHYYLGYLDYERALAEFARVEAALPDDPAVHEAIGFIRRRQGRLDEAIERLERSMRLDPQNAHTVLMLAGTHAGRRHHAIADSLFDRVIALEPDSPAAYEEKAANVLSWRGSVAEARAITARIPGRTDAARSLFAARFDVLERDFAAAEQRLRRLDPAQLPSAANFMEHVLLYGEVLQHLGRQDEAAAWLAQSIDDLDRKLSDNPGAVHFASGLAIIHASLGHHQEAERLLQEAAQRRPNDRFYGVGDEFARAIVRMILGDHEAAVEALASLLEREYFMPLCVTDLRLDPVWDPLRDQPAFQRLLASRSAGET
jgi:TolB-like protein/Flp pilus assembly protein TadD